MIDKNSYLPQFQKAFDHTFKEVSGLHTGRASIQMLDDVLVEAYGTKMHLNELGSLSAPDPTLLVVSPWDKSLISAIEKAIQIANLNVNPVVDGEVVKIPVPSLTQERREEMTKTLHQKAEGGRVLIRTVRGDVKHTIDEQKGEPGVSEDAIELALTELENTTKQYIEKIDALVKNKEAELMAI